MLFFPFVLRRFVPSQEGTGTNRRKRKGKSGSVPALAVWPRDAAGMTGGVSWRDRCRDIADAGFWPTLARTAANGVARAWAEEPSGGHAMRCPRPVCETG